MFFDRLTCKSGCGNGLHIVSPRGGAYEFAIRLKSKLTNNQTEYEAICRGLELLLEAGAEAIEIFGDSKVVIHQLTEDYNCASDLLHPYFIKCQDLMLDSAKSPSLGCPGSRTMKRIGWCRLHLGTYRKLMIFQFK